MLSDLMLALQGIPGAVFHASTQDKGAHILKVNEAWDFHGAEIDVLNQLCDIGTNYVRLRRFVMENGTTGAMTRILTNSHNASSTGLKVGVYVAALAEKIEDLLGIYRSTLVRIDESCQRDPAFSITTILAELAFHRSLLQALNELCSEIERREAHGGQVLQLIHSYSQCGNPGLQQAFNAILLACHKPLLNQLKPWLKMGVIWDPYGEFFIQKCHTPGSKPIDVVQKFGSRFTIREDTLPSYISVETAQNIMFIGELVGLFSSTEGEKADLGIYEQHRAEIQALLDKFQKDLPNLLHSALTDPELVQIGTFDRLQCEMICQNMKMGFACELWKISVRQSDLFEQLQHVKDIFLLGKGELWLTFIDLASDVLKTPVNQVSNDQPAALMRKAAFCFFDLDALLDCFDLKLQGWANERKEIPPAWDRLEISLKFPWIFRLVFSKRFLEDLNLLFGHLLRIRRVEHALHQCWISQTQRSALDRVLNDLALNQSQFWLVRMEMLFLLQNLQYYLQVDVLDALFHDLREKIDANWSNFQAVKQTLDNFSAQMLAHCLLQDPYIKKWISDLLGICEKYATVFQRLMEKSVKERHRKEVGKQVGEIYENFRRNSSILFSLLSASSLKVGGVAGSQRVEAKMHSCVTQLLLRLDYNKYFSFKNSLSS